MNQQSAAPVLLERDQTLVSDMFFSLWTNSYPEQVRSRAIPRVVACLTAIQMPNDLVPIDVEGGEVGWSRGEGIDQWRVVYTNIVRTSYVIRDENRS